jgi:hypothetical protein
MFESRFGVSSDVLVYSLIAVTYGMAAYLGADHACLERCHFACALLYGLLSTCRLLGV